MLQTPNYSKWPGCRHHVGISSTFPFRMQQRPKVCQTPLNRFWQPGGRNSGTQIHPIRCPYKNDDCCCYVVFAFVSFCKTRHCMVIAAKIIRFVTSDLARGFIYHHHLFITNSQNCSLICLIETSDQQVLESLKDKPVSSMLSIVSKQNTNVSEIFGCAQGLAKAANHFYIPPVRKK